MPYAFSNYEVYKSGLIYLFHIRMGEYEVIVKTAMQHATSAKVLVPKRWIGWNVRAVRIEPDNEGEEKID